MSASSKKKLRKEQQAAQLTEKQQKEQRESKKLKAYSITFIVVLAVVVCLAIGIAGTTAFINSGILERNTDALTVGEHTLNSAELGYYYMDAIDNQCSNWYSTYGDYMSVYLSMMGLDMSKPLNAQTCPNLGDGKTWADFFSQIAIDNATLAYTFYDEAVKNNFNMPEEAQQKVEANISSVQKKAISNGFNDTESYLKAKYGNGATQESFREYLEVSSLVAAFMEEKYNSLSYTEDDIKSYNDEHYDDFVSFSYSVFYMNPNSFIVCSADEDDTEHVHSDKEIAAAMKAVKKAAEELANSDATTVAELNALVADLEVYKDNSSAKFSEYDSILYSQIQDKNVAKWLIDEDRTAGEIDVIPYVTTDVAEDGTETSETDGYYVVMFHGKSENNMNLVNVRHILAKFEGGSIDSVTGQTVYSDAEIAAAKAKIEAVKDAWLAGETADEQSFIAMVAENSDDPGSAANGGLYEEVYPGQMVETFNNWCFEKGRKSGDYGIIQTEYGFHLIYFVDYSKTTYREYMIESTLRSNDYNDWYSALSESASSVVHTLSRLELDMVLGS